MANSVTVRDIAQGAAVSAATVSRVLNNHSHVKEEVRQRVFKAAKELGYLTRNPAERQLREIIFFYGSSFDFSPAPLNPFWSQILQGAERESSKSGIKITYRSLYELNATPDALISSLKTLQDGGVLLVGPAEPRIIQIIQETKIPLVLIDNYIPKTALDSVISDNFGGAKQAVDHLLAQGHRQIAFIGGPSAHENRPINRIYTIARRAAGYRTALLDAGLEIDYKLYTESDLSPEGGYRACRQLLEKGLKFSALFCANDSVAFGAMKALRETGLLVPDDVSVAGFDDIDMAAHYHPALTTVRVNKAAMGAAAVRTLRNRMSDPEIVSTTLMLEVELIERESVSKAKGL